MKRGLIFIVFCLFISCGKDDDCKGRIYQPLNDIVVKSIPYGDKQLVSFKTNTQETFKASVERIFEVKKFDIPHSCEEILEINLKTSGSSSTNFFMQFVQRGSNSTSNYIQVAISSNRDNYSNVIQILVKENGELSEFLSNGKSVLHSILTIDGKIYNNVIELNYDQAGPKDITQLFYNTAYGVIQFQTKAGLIVTQTV